MTDIKLTFDVVNTSNSNDIGIEAWLDNTKFFDQLIGKGTYRLGHVFPEDSADHQLKITMKNKQDHHTTIDANGNILDDVLLRVENCHIDGINIDTIMHGLAKYSHTQNGNAELSDYKFAGPLGCNGDLTLKFTTPLYMWLLENM